MLRMEPCMLKDPEKGALDVAERQGAMPRSSLTMQVDPHLTENVETFGLRKSIPAQICQFILYCNQCQ